MDDPKKCPECGSEHCSRDEADVGVGVIYGPWRCGDCGWSEPVEDYGIIDPISDQPGFE